MFVCLSYMLEQLGPTLLRVLPFGTIRVERIAIMLNLAPHVCISLTVLHQVFFRAAFSFGVQPGREIKDKLPNILWPVNYTSPWNVSQIKYGSDLSIIYT